MKNVFNKITISQIPKCKKMFFWKNATINQNYFYVVLGTVFGVINFKDGNQSTAFLIFLDNIDQSCFFRWEIFAEKARKFRKKILVWKTTPKRVVFLLENFITSQISEPQNRRHSVNREQNQLLRCSLGNVCEWPHLFLM